MSLPFDWASCFFLLISLETACCVLLLLPFVHGLSFVAQIFYAVCELNPILVQMLSEAETILKIIDDVMKTCARHCQEEGMLEMAVYQCSVMKTYLCAHKDGSLMAK